MEKMLALLLVVLGVALTANGQGSGSGSCTSSPCQHGGTCEENASGFVCLCSPGYNGNNCENLWLTKDAIASQRHEVYTRWGRQDCPSGADLIYAGLVGGSYVSHTGSGTNLLCMPPEPQYDLYDDFTWRGIIYGAVYEMYGQSQPYSSSLSKQRATCAVCLARNKTTTLMLPAQYTCPSGWHREYHGYVMSTQWNQKRSTFLCFDDVLQALPKNGHPGHRLSPVGAVHGYGLPDTYEDAPRELTCAVCTK